MSREKRVKILESELEKYKAYENKIKELEENLKNMEKSRDNHLDMLNQTQDDIRILNAKISHTNEDNRELQFKLSQKERELESIKKTIEDSTKEEERIEKELKKLIVEEKALEKLIKKARLTIDPIIRDYSKFVKEYEHTFHAYEKGLSGDAWSENSKKRMEHYFSAGGNHSDEQRKKMESLGLSTSYHNQNAGNAENAIERILRLLVRIHTHLTKLEKFVTYEIKHSERQKEVTIIIEKYLKKSFKEAFNFENREIIKVNEYLEKAFEERNVEEKHIDEANKAIIDICEKIVGDAGIIAENFEKKEIQVFFEGFEGFAKGSIKKLTKFFSTFIKELNKHEELAMKISERENEDVKKSEKLFDIMLKKEIDLVSNL